jgi:hypothetical protein
MPTERPMRSFEREQQRAFIRQVYRAAHQLDRADR